MKRIDRKDLLVALLLPAMAACQSLAPALTSAIVAFGQDLLSTAAFNYRPQYAESVSNLLLAMAQTTTGLQFTELPDNYYAIRRENIQAQRQQEAYLQQQQQYAEPQYAYGQPPGYGTPAATYDQTTYDQTTYGGEAAYDPATVAGDPYGQQDYGYATDGYGYADSAGGEDQGYATVRSPSGAGGPAPGVPTAPRSLDVALLAQTRTPDGGIGLREVDDGDVLYDGGSNPAAGDKIKLSFRASCRCYLYVIGIDATGWVTKIYPAPNESVLPLTAEKDYLLPAGETWWGLDQHKGVEQIYFVLSAERRLDIEQTLAALPDERPAVPGTGYRGVGQPAVVPVRGLVKVQAPAPTTVPTSSGSQEVAPTSFVSSLGAGDVVVTRWFTHQ